jgi:hypothetical protein
MQTAAITIIPHLIRDAAARCEGAFDAAQVLRRRGDASRAKAAEEASRRHWKRFDALWSAALNAA